MLLHPNDEICTQYIYIYLNHWMPSQSSPPSGLGESGASSSMKGTFKGNHGDTQMLHAESHRPRWVLPVVSGFERSWQQLLHPQLPSDWPCEMDMIVGNGEMCIKGEIAERCVRMCKVLENALYKGTLENAHTRKN